MLWNIMICCDVIRCSMLCYAVWRYFLFCYAIWRCIVSVHVVEAHVAVHVNYGVNAANCVTSNRKQTLKGCKHHAHASQWGAASAQGARSQAPVEGGTPTPGATGVTLRRLPL